MRQPNIILTGFMGTGKSTAGRLLAEQLGRPLVDTDELIAARAGRPIADIFAEEGEAAFRALEAAVARELAGQEGLIIASGGRLMLDPLNALLLAAGGVVVCLTAGPEEILARLGPEVSSRPLLAGPDPAGRVRALLAERQEGYDQFPQVNTSGKSPEAVAEEVLALVEELARGGHWPQELTSRIAVHYPEAYTISAGRGLLARLAEVAPLPGPAAVVTDSQVGPLVAGQLGSFDCRAFITIPAGEQYKTLETVRAIYDQLLAAGLDRQGTVVALGGGVVGDIAGFAAATYLRGVRLVQCPTTLLAMVDASVGGKTAVDLPQGKNLIGAFKQPTAVVADLAALQTLPPAEFAAGMAEVVKSGLIASPQLLERIEQEEWQTPERSGDWPGLALQAIVVETILIKRDVVEADPFERGRRAVLNLGHTFGHAIEQASGYTIGHGQAVAMGLVAAARLSAGLGYCPPELPPRVEAVLAKAGLPTRIPAGIPAGAIIQAMGSDKKRASGRLRFVLLRDVGDVFVTGDVPEAAVREVLMEVTGDR
ncbi:MAG: 3-dehydroquinate synthase [Chloroflexi bacterium]|nr:3-dehydroquinate synthase [Chloroflexota bacterium]MCI0649988.1 3-dehydroquinate synthase [Chloroflexota bacterium]MCI0727425.1 3-dehydroquinate synthase [Chloroflexota bacterium]